MRISILPPPQKKNKKIYRKIQKFCSKYSVSIKHLGHKSIFVQKFQSLEFLGPYGPLEILDTAGGFLALLDIFFDGQKID